MSSCPFCERVTRDGGEAGKALAFRDAYPLAEGHTLVIPVRHVASLFDLTTEEWDQVWRLVAQVRHDLVRELNPDGFNIGVNDGEAAGQTVEHAHVHVIPRRRGDVVDPRGGVRAVIPTRRAWWDDQGAAH